MWIWVAFSLLSLALVALAYRHRQLTQRLQFSQDAVQQQLRDIEQRLLIVNESAVGVGQQLLQTEKRIRQLSNKQQQIEQQSPEYLTYDHAEHMIHHGAALDDLIQRCGLSEAEAKLMTRIKQPRTVSSN